MRRIFACIRVQSDREGFLKLMSIYKNMGDFRFASISSMRKKYFIEHAKKSFFFYLYS